MCQLGLQTLVDLFVLASEIGGASFALQLLTGVSFRLWTILVALLIWVLLWGDLRRDRTLGRASRFDDSLFRRRCFSPASGLKRGCTRDALHRGVDRRRSAVARRRRSTLADRNGRFAGTVDASFSYGGDSDVRDPSIVDAERHTRLLLVKKLFRQHVIEHIPGNGR